MADTFRFSDGKTANTVAELTAVLESTDKKIFEQHVTRERNDFANWLEHSLHETQLAGELRKTTDRFITIATLRAHLRKKVGTPVPVTPVQKSAPGTAPAVTPPVVHHFLEEGHQKEFLFGLAIGIIMGVLLLRILQVLA